ncbi:SIR2 family protein [bacterium]|nr:SIR2 family protein [bacterium]
MDRSIIRLAANARPGKKQWILVVGAGVSKDAGIHTAWDLMMEIAAKLYVLKGRTGRPDPDMLEAWFLGSEYAEKSFSELTSEIYSTDAQRRSFLDDYIGGKPAGEAHQLIAELARRGILRAIVTTNFDCCIENALHAKNLKPQVIVSDADVEGCEPLEHCYRVRIYKPHGSLDRGDLLRVTPAELAALPKKMTAELRRRFSEHGVIVLGYAGLDKGLQSIIERRKTNHFPLCWIDPNAPIPSVDEYLTRTNSDCVTGIGAADFLRSFLDAADRLDALAGTLEGQPSVAELRDSTMKLLGSQNHAAIAAKYTNYMKGVAGALEKTRPDFSKYEYEDDAIVAQIESAEEIVASFIEAIIEAVEFGIPQVNDAIYEGFGYILPLCDLPKSFPGGRFSDTDFDGFRFAAWEMFVAFIAALIRFERWEELNRLLSRQIFSDDRRPDPYKHFTEFRSYLRSLDDLRNSRLTGKRQVSVAADTINYRYISGRLARLLSFDDFMEAEFFLFARSAMNEGRLWYPMTLIYLKQSPILLRRAASYAFFKKLLLAIGASSADEFKKKYTEAIGKLERLNFRYLFDYVKLDELGSLP